ncbi:transmembrane, partial [Cystoisospora suis]
MATWICQIAIIACLFFFFDNQRYFPIQMFSLNSMSQRLWVWHEIPVDIRVCLIIISGHFLMMNACWVLSAPVLDVFSISFFGSLKLFSFFLMILTFRDFRTFHSIFNLHHIIPDVEKYAIFLFALIP